MTLIVNEIHLLDGLSKTILVAAADRRLSKPDGSYADTQRKLFRVPQLNGTVSYFGVAYVLTHGTEELLSSWLPNFINKQSEVSDLKTFAWNLRDTLNQVVPEEWLQRYPSGFHICGYNSQGLPDLWAFLNAGRMRGPQYLDVKAKYCPPSSSFLERDARMEFGWDGTDPSSARTGIQTYRNGDYRAHIAMWDYLDRSLFGNLFQLPDFKRPGNPREYGKYVKFKLKVIAYVYQEWAEKQSIAGPIDVIVLDNTSGRDIEVTEL